RCQAGRLLLPATLQHVESGFMIRPAATLRSPFSAIAVEYVVPDRVPLLAWLECDFEAESPVGVCRRTRVVNQAINKAPAEVTIRTSGIELTAGLVPLGRDVAAPHKAAGFDLKQIREVRAKGDLQVE